MGKIRMKLGFLRLELHVRGSQNFLGNNESDLNHHTDNLGAAALFLTHYSKVSLPSGSRRVEIEALIHISCLRNGP